MPLAMPSESLTNGMLEGDEAAEADGLDRPEATEMVPSLISTVSGDDGVTAEMIDTGMDGEAEGAVDLTVDESEVPLEQRFAAGGHPCSQCDRVFMSMQGLRSHERSHSAVALFSREDKYSCQYCQFVSPFRHK